MIDKASYQGANASVTAEFLRHTSAVLAPYSRVPMHSQLRLARIYGRLFGVSHPSRIHVDLSIRAQETFFTQTSL